MSLVISPAVFRKMLFSRSLLLVDTRPVSSYAESHIPGAVDIDLMQFHWIDTSKQGIAQFNNQAKLLLSNIGVSKNKFVVFYDDISGTSAARGVWPLLYLSHDKVERVDGGLNRWMAEGSRQKPEAIRLCILTLTASQTPTYSPTFHALSMRQKRKMQSLSMLSRRKSMKARP